MIKTGILSYGMSGKLFHAPFIESHPEFELTAIVERTKNESREKYPEAKLYRSVDELINDPAIELVVVNTPVQTHFEFAKKSIEAGKHTIVEKPFTVTLAEGEELFALAEKHNVLLSVYQNRRYDGDYHAVKNILALDLLGDIKEVEIRFDRYRPELSGKIHKESDLPGSGTLYDLGSHIIDQSLQLFGWPNAVFGDVWAMKENAQTDDYFELLLYYDGLRVRLKASSMVRESYYGYILHGSKGSFLQHRSDLQEQQLLKGVIPTIEPWCKPQEEADGILHTEVSEGVIRKTTFSTPGNYMGYYNDIHHALLNNGPNPVPATDSIKGIRIIQAAMESSAEGKRINLK